MEPLKVVSTQFELVDGDIQENMRRAEALAREVAENEKNVDLMLFSECCLESGMDFSDYEEKLTSTVIAEIEQFWRRMAKTTGIYILAGHVGREQDGAWRNYATCFAPDGTIYAQYAKAHLYMQERGFFKPGDEKVIFDLKGYKIGILICADLGFPEFSRQLALAGANVFAVPSCWGYPHDDLWILCNRLRAAENNAYMVSCNRYGKCGDRFVLGNSMVTNPRGEIIANLGVQPRGYFVANILQEEIERERMGVLWLQWLRPELYQ